MTEPTSNKEKNVLKYVSLVTMTFQAAILTLSLRYGRTRVNKEDLFFSSTAVMLTEFTKLFTCLVIVFFESGRSFRKFGSALREKIFENKIDTLKVCLPSLLYVVQNNLLYLAISNLDAAMYLITSRMKILSTAIFAVIILRVRLLIRQWASFFILIAGIVIINLSDENAESKGKDNRLLGFGAVLAASVISGFSGIFLEKMFKQPDISLWMRNVQMSLVGVPLAILTCLISSFNGIHTKGFFHGYDYFVVYLVLMQALSGLIVATVMKYAGNILKVFASSIAIIVASIVSIYLFDFHLSVKFLIGTFLVIGSTFLYSYVSKTKDDKTPIENEKQLDVEKNGIENVACEVDEKIEKVKEDNKNENNTTVPSDGLTSLHSEK